MKRVYIKLSNGKVIKLNLYEEYAPITVANFLHLVDTNFYEGTIFHRTIQGFMVQGGGYTITEDGQLVEKNPGYTIPGEFRNNGFACGFNHTKGVISMARTSDPNSASSQFFICDEDAPHLDSNYATFGIIADQESYDTIHEIACVPTVTLNNGMQDFPTAQFKDITISEVGYWAFEGAPENN